MKVNILRKVLVLLIFATPLVSYSGCKKQAKCGCGKDVLYTLTNTSAHVFWESGSSIWFITDANPYAYYYFCNPTEMFKTMGEYKSGDQLLISGDVFYDCNYQYQASNSTYATYQQVYNVQVTDVHMDLYGKK